MHFISPCEHCPHRVFGTGTMVDSLRDRLNEQTVRAEHAERHRARLIDRIMLLACPRGEVDCRERKPGSCNTCWLEWADQSGEEEIEITIT